MDQIKYIIFLIINVIILNSCKKNDISVVSFYLADNNKSSPCFSEALEKSNYKELIVVLKNNSNDTAYFQSGDNFIQPKGIILNYNSEKQYVAIDDFSPITYDLYLNPNAVDSFCISSEMTYIRDSIEYILNYKINNINKNISLFYIKQF